jgi:hypothetical protein
MLVHPCVDYPCLGGKGLIIAEGAVAVSSLIIKCLGLRRDLLHRIPLTANSVLGLDNKAVRDDNRLSIY